MTFDEAQEISNHPTGLSTPAQTRQTTTTQTTTTQNTTKESVEYPLPNVYGK
jgi:hypothetical protein